MPIETEPHPDFAAAFTPGPRVLPPDLKVDVQVREAGTLVVRSGRVAACDPFAGAAPPFEARVPDGQHPVTLSVLRYADNGDERVACARVAFAARPVARWRMALVAGQTLDELGPGEAFGYAVDGGVGCFADARAAAALGDLDADALAEALEAREVDTWSASEWPLGTGELVAFTSGLGDGIYTSWFGLDEAGSPVCLVTDFQLLPPAGARF